MGFRLTAWTKSRQTYYSVRGRSDGSKLDQAGAEQLCALLEAVFVHTRQDAQSQSFTSRQSKDLECFFPLFRRAAFHLNANSMWR
jgi:hypothetical protein